MQVADLKDERLKVLIEGFKEGVVTLQELEEGARIAGWKVVTVGNEYALRRLH